MALPQEQINDLRQRVIRGETIPREQYREIIASLRTKRADDIAAASVVKEKKAKAVKKVTTDEELNDILGL